MALIQVSSLDSNSDFVNGFASALAKAERTDYVVVDKHTRRAIAPIAPFKGYLGVSADVARQHPGMTAMSIENVTRDARESFANFLDGSARHSERYIMHCADTMASRATEAATLKSGTTKQTEAARAADTWGKRMQRESELLNRYIEQASAIRATL